ncbi:MAG: hypothetical protein CMM07_03860 [Rhodopirellula sp.]|nr:hypothetical protein [Rhodopirellula sp.]
MFSTVSTCLVPRTCKTLRWVINADVGWLWLKPSDTMEIGSPVSPPLDLVGVGFQEAFYIYRSSKVFSIHSIDLFLGKVSLNQFVTDPLV